MGWSHGNKWTDDLIAAELTKIAKLLGRMPTYAEMSSALDSAVRCRGGIREWAARIGFKPKGRGGHNKRWTDELIEESLLPFIGEFGRMPSYRELQSVGRCDLGNAISRGRGFHWWATRLKVEQKGHNTHRGQKWERHEVGFFRGHGFVVEDQPTGAPFDLIVGGHRVDVKISKYHESLGWFQFGNIKNGIDCDFFDMLCIRDGCILGRFVIPSAAARVRSVTIMPSAFDGRGKYGPYKDAIDLLRGNQLPL